MKKTMKQLIEEDFWEFLISTMENKFPDFSDSRKKYLQVMDSLQRPLGENAVKKEMEAIDRQLVTISFFSFVLGIQANYRNFTDPVGGNFLNTDPEVYLRENIAKSLPDYTAAQLARDDFYGRLDSMQQQAYQAVTEYTCFFETVGPKLAHYYGYLVGNDLLQRVIPGYCPDIVLTSRYCITLENYLGKRVDWNHSLTSSFSLC